MSRRDLSKVFACALLTSLFVPTPAYADMGPSWLIVAFGLFSIGIVETVVVAIETPVLKYSLDIPHIKAFGAALAGNAISAVLGLPVAYIAGYSLAMRLDPFQASGDIGFIAVIVIVSFVFSSLVEWPLVKAIAHRPWLRSAITVLIANVLSHAMLAVLLIAYIGA